MALLVLVEGLIVLWGFGLGSHGIIGGDGAQYNTYALNLEQHGVFSDVMTPPFFASVYRTPGYPLFLALLRLLAPGSLLLVRIAQFGLLAATAMLVHSIGRSLLSERVAIVGAVLCATYLPFVWLSTYHLTEVLSVFLCTLTVWAMIRAGVGRREGLRRYACVGVAVAILAMVRPEFAPTVVPIAAGMFMWDQRGSRRRRAVRATVLLGAFLVVMAPWTIRNAIVAHRFIPLGAASGESLYVSAEQYAGAISYTLPPPEYTRLFGPNGTFDQIAAPAERRVLASRATSGIAFGTRLELADNDAITSAAGHAFSKLTVSQVLGALPKRIAYLWGTADYVPAGLSFGLVAHRLAQLQWLLILALAAIGVVAGIRVLRVDIWLLLVFPVFVTCEHLVFHSEGRYSIPPRGCVLILAAMGAAAVGRRLAAARQARRHVFVELAVARDPDPVQ